MKAESASTDCKLIVDLWKSRENRVWAGTTQKWFPGKSQTKGQQTDRKARKKRRK